MRIKLAWTLAFLLVFSLHCGGRKDSDRALISQVGQRVQEGLASWYGPGYHGRLTASGERFDQNGLTAAHYSLPFGTRVRVTNQKNGKTVVVVINDRYPIETLRKGRIIDLARGAAQVLGMVRDGVVPVRLQVLR